ncbi:type IV pilus assembly protein PilW [Pseudomonas cuatrocienegasensis]|uniref:Type IV pilus assembly protein PilW n=1 Tax=Pseudomonas cuatrocienegasensis TaxID=543360 RepID=A0ABY1BCH2_9PSED|nr:MULTISPECIES: PilW family protein [Pseudomonas]OEC35593.1 pilus assembly protein PilW [Pseudomonas sp. 21C1]SEQ50791.1 type IV pilus assembly protein PilW [Pseudomonas cuatrocienegasensis]
MNTVKPQFGLSLIELLIALAISSLLILGITQVYIDNKRNYVFQQNQAGNLENSRFASLMLNEYLGKAGYRRDPVILIEEAFPDRSASGDCQAFGAGHSITGLAPNVGIGFCIRYQPKISGELDCQGAASASFDDTVAFSSPPTSSLIILAFKYAPSTDNELPNGRLLCKSLNVSSPQYGELLRGIADMRVDFGIGNSDILEKKISGFVPQSDWTAANGAIRSVRYSLLMASRSGQRDSDDSKILDDWLATAATDDKTRLQDADNRHLYQVTSSTQTVRNLMP